MNLNRLEKALAAWLTVLAIGFAGAASAATITPTGCTSSAVLSFGCNYSTSPGGGTLYMANAAISSEFTDTYTFNTTGPAGTLYALRLDIGPWILTDLEITLVNSLPASPQTFSLLAPGVLVASLLLDTTGANTLSIKATADGWLDKAGYKAALTAVPLPAAAWLFISALGGLILVGRRRRMFGATAA